MEVFDWIFDGDDMVVLLLVDDVDDCRLSGTFAGAGGTGDEHQTVPQLGNLARVAAANPET